MGFEVFLARINNRENARKRSEYGRRDGRCWQGNVGYGGESGNEDGDEDGGEYGGGARKVTAMMAMHMEVSMHHYGYYARK